MTRLQKYESLKVHPWYHRVVNSLKPEGQKFVLDFIEKHKNLNKYEFSKEVDKIPSTEPGAFLKMEILSIVGRAE